MATVVMKFGGASVSNPQKFSHIADIVAARRKDNEKIVVVVSAMGGATDQLIDLARQVHPSPPTRELDMLVSTGERVSISLLAMALSLKKIDAISFTGSQSGIITTCDHTEARIIDVRPLRILRHLQEGKVVIVAGFQGVSKFGEITTLGRGGSDTSAVAIGVALGATKVEFFKDVDGIYSVDPKVDPKAIHYPVLEYEQALSIIERGAKVLHGRAVKLAQKNFLPLQIRSFFSEKLNNTLISCKQPMNPRNPDPLYEIEFNE